MDPKIRQIIENSILQSKKIKKEFLLFGRIMVFIQNPLVSDFVDFDNIIGSLEKFIPPHLLEDIDIIYVGQYQDLIDRGLEALYQSGAIYRTNTLAEDIDYIENIIHESAHALEETHGMQIYGDGGVNSEFVAKRERLLGIIKAQGYDTSGLDFSNSEYQQDLDDFLYKEVGYDSLNYLINGLFLNPYAVTSIREYFASGLEKYLLDGTKRDQLRKISPQLTRKIEELINGYQD